MNERQIDTNYYLEQQMQKPIARLFKDIIGQGDEDIAAKKLFKGEHANYRPTSDITKKNPFSKQ